MADTTVFVDDAVQGRLPPICVREGIPADAWLLFEKPVGGMGAGAWVLVLLGPLGWLALAILSGLGTGRETLEVKLPYSRAALDRFKARRRVLTTAWAVAIVTIVGGLFFGRFIDPVAIPIVGGGAILVALVYQVMLALEEVDVKLDASRRWVTLKGVHDRFARAVAVEQDRGIARP
jgi:predicted secreted protein